MEMGKRELAAAGPESLGTADSFAARIAIQQELRQQCLAHHVSQAADYRAPLGPRHEQQLRLLLRRGYDVDEIIQVARQYSLSPYQTGGTDLAERAYVFESLSLFFMPINAQGQTRLGMNLEVARALCDEALRCRPRGAVKSRLEGLLKGINTFHANIPFRIDECCSQLNEPGNKGKKTLEVAVLYHEKRDLVRASEWYARSLRALVRELHDPERPGRKPERILTALAGMSRVMGQLSQFKESGEIESLYYRATAYDCQILPDIVREALSIFGSGGSASSGTKVPF